MLGTILELNQEGRMLCIERGFLCISHNKEECGRVPIDSLEGILVTAHKASFTRPFLVALAEHNIPLIICNNQYKPVSVSLAYSTHYEAGKRMRLQASASLPLNKSLWRACIKEKIQNQADVLKFHRSSHPYGQKLELLAKNVLSGDSSRKEGQAARLYWHALMGKGFIRDPDALDENIFFNYAYTIVRTAVMRSLLASGLHPALGVYHSHPLNSFALADDLMEAFRPLADHFVLSIEQEKERTNKEEGKENRKEKENGKESKEYEEEIRLTPAIKKHLASILKYTVLYEGAETPLYQAIHNTALSLAKTYLRGALCLKFPVIKLENIL